MEDTTNPNYPGKRKMLTDTPITSGFIRDEWLKALTLAEKLQGAFCRADKLSRDLEAQCLALGIPCEKDMWTNIDAAKHDSGVDGIVAYIDEEIARYEGR